MTTPLQPGEEWRLELDAERGLWLVVLAHPGYFDFHLTDVNDGVVVSVFGYTQRLTLASARDDEPGGWLEVGGTLIYVPHDQALAYLAARLNTTVS